MKQAADGERKGTTGQLLKGYNTDENSFDINDAIKIKRKWIKSLFGPFVFGSSENLLHQ